MNTKNQKKLEVSIGIPAYNEEANIGYLLHALLAQKEKNFTLKEIIVVSDGSTDKTEAIIRSFTDPRIKVIHDNKRLGQQIRQNQILKMYKSEILVLMEADTLPVDDYCINELVKPFAFHLSFNLGMVVGDTFSIAPETFFETILFHGTKLKKTIFTTWRNSNNLYSCSGHTAKALSRHFASQISWPKDVPEDAYTYLLIRKLKFEMLKQKSAKIYMKNVSNIQDQIKQSIKFTSGKCALKKYFESSFLHQEYSIPVSIKIRCLFSAFIREPFWVTLYFFEVITNRVLTLGFTKFNELYIPYESSKKIYG